MEEPTAQESRWGKRVEQVSKLALGAAGLFYVLGLLVTSLHLMPFGVFSLSLIRLHYVLAGVWPMLPLLLVASVLAWILAAWEDQHQLDSQPPASASRAVLWSYYLKVALGIVTATASLVAVSLMVMAYVLRGVGLPWSFGQILVGSLLVTAFFLGLFFLALLTGVNVLASWRRPDPARLSRRPLWSAAFGSLLVLCLLAYLRFFVDHIYPVIPLRIGGGKPLPVTIVLKSSESVASIGLATRGRPGEGRALRGELLLDGDKTYVLRTVDGPSTVIELSKDVVASVVLDDRR